MPTEREREMWDRQVRALREIEADEVPSETSRTIAGIDAERAARGIAPLGRETHPEEELYRRARTLGLRRRRG